MHPAKPAACIASGFFLIFFSLFSTYSSADTHEPFATRNQSLFSLIYGLPVASPAELLTSGQSRFTSSLNITNTLNIQSSNNEQLQVDIETWQLKLVFDLGLSSNSMLRFQLPYIAHSGGLLDSPIDNYHQALGLPEDLRPGFPHNQLLVIYEQNSEQLRLDQRQQQIGDISIQLAWQHSQTEDMSLSYWLGLKLPTGDASAYTGSGHLDLAGWAAASYRLKDTRWLYAQAGILYMSDTDTLKSIHNNWAGFANLGMKFEPWQKLQLKAQFDMHTALYDSQLEFLGHVVQLTFGGSYLPNKQNSFDLAIAEDIQSGASPDVTFNLSWSRYF